MTLYNRTESRARSVYSIHITLYTKTNKINRNCFNVNLIECYIVIFDCHMTLYYRTKSTACSIYTIYRTLYTRTNPQYLLLYSSVSNLSMFSTFFSFSNFAIYGKISSRVTFLLIKHIIPPVNILIFLKKKSFKIAKW